MKNLFFVLITALSITGLSAQVTDSTGRTVPATTAPPAAPAPVVQQKSTTTVTTTTESTAAVRTAGPGTRTFSPGILFNPLFGWMNLEPNDKSYTASGSGARLGLSYGVSLDYFFADNFGISTQLLFTYIYSRYHLANISNTNDTYNPIAQDIEYRNTIQYFQIPVLLKMRTNEINYLRYFANIGLAPSIKVRSRSDRYVAGAITDEGLRDAVRDFNIFLVAGLGAQYDLSGSTALSLGVNYNEAFIDPTPDRVGGVNATLRYISINLGIYF